MYSSPAESVLPKEAFSRTRSSCSVHLPGEGASLSRPLSSQLPRDRAACNATHTHSSAVTAHTQHTHRQTHMKPLGMGQFSRQQLWRANQRLRMIEAVVVFLYLAYWWYWAKKFSNIWRVSCVFLIKPPHTKFWLSDVAQLLFHLQSVLPRSRVLTQTWHLSRVRRKHSVARSLAPCFLRTKPETGIWWEIDIVGGSLRDSFRIDLSFLC